jgi:hypothetical protein
MAFEFLIVGTGRGGTSLLMGLLDTHSKLEVASEYASPGNLKDASRKMYDRVEAFKQACLAEAARHPDKVWGNKILTDQVYALESGAPQPEFDVLDYFFNQSFPTIKVVYILRDGRTSVRSKVNRGGLTYEKACKDWNRSVEMYKFVLKYPGRYLAVRFEDLLVDPPAVLTQITDYLGVPYEAQMLAGTDNPKLLPEYRNPGFDRSKMNIGRPSEWQGLIAENLRFCGYVQD